MYLCNMKIKRMPYLFFIAVMALWMGCKDDCKTCKRYDANGKVQAIEDYCGKNLEKAEMYGYMILYETFLQN